MSSTKGEPLRAEVFTLLVGNEVHPVITSTCQWLQVCGIKEGAQKIYEDMVRREGGAEVIDAIATATVITTAQCPVESIALLRLLKESFGANTEAVTGTPVFALGAALGIFGSMAWLNQNWSTNVPLDDEWPDFVATLITANNNMTGILDAWVFDEEFPKGYEGKLSEAVRLAMRGKSIDFSGLPEGSVMTGRRIADLQKIVARVIETRGPILGGRKGKKSLSGLGELIANELFFIFRRQFGSPEVLLLLAHHFFEDIVAFIANSSASTAGKKQES